MHVKHVDQIVLLALQQVDVTHANQDIYMTLPLKHAMPVLQTAKIAL